MQKMAGWRWIITLPKTPYDGSVWEKNWLFFGSDHGGERGASLYSLIGTCKLNGVDPERYLHYVLDVIADWPVNRWVLCPWRVTLPA
jgi:transposase